MSRLDETLSRLKAKGAVMAEEQGKKRKETWTRIQTEAPDIAEFMTECAKTFGKPEQVWVWIGEERIL